MKILPYQVPKSRAQMLILYCVRRMGAWGLHDAMAANAMLNNFGLSYQRPLILLRNYMQESAKTSVKRIKIAPCCCRRATHDEKNMLTILALSLDNPHKATSHLTLLTGMVDNMRLLTCAQALSAAFTDLGHPISSQMQDD
ncbi:hypothetical protein LPB140_09625 [Sphingorhabdus lutea]|uniref:Uncharacterized protein n=2 Tax=Sphingorhabdus lutea TaxID=1913578 RepID=A0A1L3JF40_9SPHN|nr:hypothetical protein LPB140_09625 [Sphingorhabdus lutea]